MNQTINLTSLINPFPKQKIALETLFLPECKYLLYGGAMAGGKSHILRWASVSLLLYLFAKTKIYGIPVGLFSEDYPTLKDRQIARIERDFPKWLGEIRDTKTEGLCFFLHPSYGSGRIMLRNLDDPSKYMSSEFAGIFVEELTRNPKQTFEDLRNRLRYPGIDEVKFMGATNPGGVGNGYARRFFVLQDTDDPEQKRFYYVHANAYDNPYISEDYRKQLESLPEQKRKAYLEGSWDTFEGQYFGEFSYPKHSCESFIPKKEAFYEFLGGMDWGRVDPFCFLLTGIKKEQWEGKVFFRAYSFAELYGTEKAPKIWGKDILNLLSFYNLTLDHVNRIQADTQIFNKSLDVSSKSIADQFIDVDERFRSILRPASKDRIQGWEAMHDWLSLAPDGYPYWRISKACPNLLRTLPELVHDEVHREDIEEQGAEDHAPSAARYMFRSLKWIDARVGGVTYKDPSKQPKMTASMDADKQIALDLTAFERKKTGVYYR